MCAHKLFSCFKWNSLFIHKGFFFFAVLKKSFGSIGLVWEVSADSWPVLPAGSLFPILSAHLKHQCGFSPMWLVCSIVTQDYCSYIHTSSWLKKESKHAYTAFKRKQREGRRSKGIQTRFCVGVYPTMEIHIYISDTLFLKILLVDCILTLI